MGEKGGATIINDPSCACGCPLEDAIHYLLECPLYMNAKMQLIMSVYRKPIDHLYGLAI
jgi:hypothetical protein